MKCVEFLAWEYMHVFQPLLGVEGEGYFSHNNSYVYKIIILQ